MNLKEIGVNTRNWIYSAHDGEYWRAPVNTAFIPWVQNLDLD